MMLALAVAAGCDLFDSAAYALMARDGRYLTVSGTEHLEDMEYFPCSCPVCAEYTPAELREMDGSGGDSADQSAEQLLAEHNLHVTFEELRRVKAAIRSGNLLQLVDRRARGHPAMLDGFRVLLDHADELERTDPVSKDAFFYTSHESARRPEVSRHHDRLSRLAVPDRLLLTESDAPSNHDYDAVWRVKPRSVPSLARSPRRTRSPQRSRSGSTVRRRSRPPRASRVSPSPTPTPNSRSATTTGCRARSTRFRTASRRKICGTSVAELRK